MKNELGIEVCCENCLWHSTKGCYIGCAFKDEYCTAFLPTIESLYNRIKELQAQLSNKTKKNLSKL